MKFWQPKLPKLIFIKGRRQQHRVSTQREHREVQISSKFSVNRGKAPLLGSLPFSSEMGWSGAGRSPLLTLVFGFAPGSSRCDPRTALPLPGLGGRQHGDGSARLLLHLLITHFRREGCSGVCVSREVRVCLSTEEVFSSKRCCCPLSLLPGLLLMLFPPQQRQVCGCTH